VNVTDEGWTPNRGDYGAHYATDLIPLIEKRNCIKGCVHSGSQSDRDEFGPGGNCHILAMVSLGAQDVRIPELVPQVHGIRCTAREDPAVAEMVPMFNMDPVTPEPIKPGETPTVHADSEPALMVSTVVEEIIKARMSLGDAT